MPCDLETLRARLRQWSDHDDKAYQTASTCLDILLQGKGGIIIFVIDEQALVKSEDFPFVYLGNHAFTRILQQTVDNFHTRKEAFGELLDAFCMHNETDRWERQEVGAIKRASDVCRQILGRKPALEKLMGQPQDGALMVDLGGGILAASTQIRLMASRWQLMRPDGTRAGTRHATGVAGVE